MVKRSEITKPAKRVKSKSRRAEKPPDFKLETHRDLRANIRAISKRFNDDPESARMLLVNPLLALEDIGVQMTTELKDHIKNALRFPPNVIERRDQLELEIFDELKQLGVTYKVPLNEEQRADLIFNVLKLKLPEAKTNRIPTEEGEDKFVPLPGLRSLEIKRLAKRHPLVAKLVEYERLRQGRVIFYPRQVYESYKAGLKRQNWIKAVRFKV
ncbi:MAG: hypothetical protein KIT61_05355 [Pyrinomonadaceae bacterium]|nr:hypothetical protein [Pyrinomonadaceae bacterium]